MDFIKRHPILFAVLGFLLITLPDAVNNWFSLAERVQQAEGIVWHLILTDWVFPLVGLTLLIVVIRQRGGVKPPLFPKNETLSWFERTLQDDRDNLGKRVYVRDYTWSFNNLKKTDSFMEMTVTLINASVFPILVNGVTGRFWIGEAECAYTAEMEGRTRIPHGESGNIRIKQHLSQEMMNHIVLTYGDHLKISLKSCKLSIQPEILGEQSEPIHIILGGDYDVPMSQVTGS